MSNWSSTQLTAKGQALEAKVTAGLTDLVFTKMKLGSGTVAPEDIGAMTDLNTPKMTLGISSCAVSISDPTICNVISIANSSDVTNSFRITELGLFATDPDEGEILYAVMLDSVPDTMPNSTAASPTTITFQINIVSSNASSISAIIDPAGLVSVQTMNAAINTHDTGATSHPLTIDDSVAPSSNHGALATIMNNVANILKQVKGDTDWKTAPGISLAAILGDFATNLSVTTDPDTGVFTCPSLGITGLMAQNGYICLGKLFGGLILQWGYSTRDGVVTFPLTFTTLFEILGTPVYANSVRLPGDMFGIKNISASGFQFMSYHIADNNAPAYSTAYWFAIGY